MKNIKSWVIFWITVFITLLLSWTIYAALWNSWVNPSSMEKNIWSSLKSDDWNNMLTDIKILWEKMWTLETALNNQSLSQFSVWYILMTTNPDNPNTYLWYGSWEEWGSWRVPVWVDSSQNEFNSVEKTWWENYHTLTIDEMPEHKHDILEAWEHFHTIGTNEKWHPDWQRDYGGVYWNSRRDSTEPKTNPAWIHTHPMESTWWWLAHNNLQSYITVYMWKRVK